MLTPANEKSNLEIREPDPAGSHSQRTGELAFHCTGTDLGSEKMTAWGKVINALNLN